MKYFRLIIFISITLSTLPLSVYGQNQNGYVKTKGRLSSNGSVISGTRISGASVILKGGNSTVSGTNGSFSVKIPSKKYYLQNVLKNDYVLTDPEVLSKQYDYSTNDLVIVMEKSDEQLEEQLDAASRIRSTLTAQLQRKEREIKRLKKENKISNEEYQRMRKELLASQQNNERLINEMVEMYSKIDYDQLDDFNRQVSNLILSGELSKADSLLKTKGTIESRINQFRKHQEANRKEGKEIEQRQYNLERSIYYEQREKEDIARDCYHYYTKCRLLQQNDSAAYYLEKRAMLDTLSFDYVWTCGSYFLNERKYEKARYYLEMLVRNETLSSVDMGMGLNDLSICYSYMGLHSLGRETIKKSLELREKLAKEEPEKYKVSVALAASNYAAQNAMFDENKDVARKYFSVGMNLYKQLLKYSEFFSVNLANVEENYGLLLYKDSLYNDAEEYLLKAFNTRLKYAKKHPHYYNTTSDLSLTDISRLIGNVDCDSFIATRECKMIIIAAAEKNKEQMANTAKSLADLYFAKRDFEKSQYYLSESNKYIDELFALNTEKFLPDLTYNCIENAYFYLNFLNDVETASRIANKIYTLIKEREVYSQFGFSKEFAESDVLVLIGRIHQKDSLSNSIDKYCEAIEILKQVSDSIIQDGKNYRLQVVYNYLSLCYYQKGDIFKAIEFCKDRLKYINDITNPNNDIYIEKCVANNNLALLYVQNENFDLALPYFKQALDIIKDHLSLFNDLDYIQVCFYYGFTLIRTGNPVESLLIMEDAQSHFKGLPKNEQSELLISNINQAVIQLKQQMNK